MQKQLKQILSMGCNVIMQQIRSWRCIPGRIGSCAWDEYCMLRSRQSVHDYILKSGAPTYV